MDVEALENTLPEMEHAMNLSLTMALHYFGEMINTFGDWLKSDKK